MGAEYHLGTSITADPTYLWYDDGLESHLQTEAVGNYERIDLDLLYNYTGSETGEFFIVWEGTT
jgi:hypothetical protein